MTAAVYKLLDPLRRFLDDPMVSEIMVNRPEEVFVEKMGDIEQVALPQLSLGHLERLLAVVAEASGQKSDLPLIGGSLPNGERIQFAQYPACERGNLVLSIRKQTVRDLSISDYVERGSFNNTKLICSALDDHTGDEDQALIELFKSGQFSLFFKQAVEAKKNIVISGGTGSGKTTLLNALAKEIPDDERIITIEDKREVILTQPNVSHLLGSAESGADVSTNDLVRASLRLRPDRILMGEIRGAEAFSWVNATATGHDGTLATVHAATASLCFNRLVLMCKQAPEMAGLGRDDVEHFLAGLIDIIIQIGDRKQGRYRFDHVHFYSR